MNILEKNLEEIEQELKLVHEEKKKVSSAVIVSRDIDKKPYYEIKYKEINSCDYDIGYGSYDLNNVVKWLNVCFEFCNDSKTCTNDTLKQILEEIENEAMTNKEIGRKQCEGMSRAMNIIRSHMGEAENYGWIPVEERLPEVPEGLADEYCPEFNVTIKGAERTTTLKYSWDGTWFDDNGNVYNVIVWQPLPAPYKPKKQD